MVNAWMVGAALAGTLGSPSPGTVTYPTSTQTHHHRVADPPTFVVVLFLADHVLRDNSSYMHIDNE